MFNFERSGLSQKLTLISVLSTGSALLLVLLVFGSSAVFSHAASQRQQLSMLASVIGSNSAAALQTGDRRRAGQTLAALDGLDDIVQAALFDRDGKLLVRYAKRDPAQADLADLADLDAAALAALRAAPSSVRSGPPWDQTLTLLQPVWRQQQLLGAVLVEGSQRQLRGELARNLGAAGLASLLSLVVALLMAARLRASIVAPVSQLIGVARQVGSSQSYGHRLAHGRSDELGTLIDSFNTMLAQIESRDSTLVQYREQLERQVGLRTEQLEKAKNAAEAASQSKSAFLATMSHEIRTPMNGVLGMTELLLATPLTEQQRHYTEMVKRSGEHLLVIINDILDFSKIEAGKLNVEYIHFNFRELLDDVEHVFAPQARAKGLALDFAIAHHIPVGLCGDPNRLRQIIVNLLGNAIKFTERGQISVRVSVTGEDEQAVGLRFEVQDSGIGIAREAQARIFDSFSQADGSTTRKHGGTGLGLSISKQLVELMGGTIGIDNALTQGSIFWFAVNFDKRRVDAGAPSFNPTLTEGLKALIVDEDSTSRAALEQQLGAWQIACAGAASATDALALLRAAAGAGQPYPLVLLDMDLTRTSGLALAATIKAEPAIAGCKILLLSSELAAADNLQRREAGVAFQLIKPARACDLFDCIVTPLRASEGVRAVTPQASRPVHGRRPRKVLLAEDNPVNVEVASAMLEGLGLEVCRAANGAEALQAVCTDDFDLVLMDCQMPVMDGFAATAEIRRHQQQSGRAGNLPIIAITANALQGDRESCLAAGMDDYLSKPFTQQALGQTLSRWISLPRIATAHHELAPSRSAPAQGPLLAAPSRPAAPPSPVPGAALSAASSTVSSAASPSVSPTAAVAAPALAAAGARPPAETARDIINRQALDNIRALSATNGDALLERVLHAFVDDTPSHLRNLHLAIDGGNTGAIRKTAHSLKSSSANVGAELLAQLCKDMEKLGRDDSTDGAAGLLREMEKEFQSVCLSLNTILEKEI